MIEIDGCMSAWGLQQVGVGMSSDALVPKYNQSLE